MNTLDLVAREERGDDGRDWYALDGDTVYPAALDYCRQLAAKGFGTRDALAVLPEGADDAAIDGLRLELTDLRRRIVALPEGAWADASKPVDEVTGRARERRAEALECARLVFTALLRAQNGRPVGLHWLRAERWRLAPAAGA